MKGDSWVRHVEGSSCAIQSSQLSRPNDFGRGRARRGLLGLKAWVGPQVLGTPQAWREVEWVWVGGWSGLRVGRARRLRRRAGPESSPPSAAGSARSRPPLCPTAHCGSPSAKGSTAPLRAETRGSAPSAVDRCTPSTTRAESATILAPAADSSSVPQSEGTWRRANASSSVPSSDGAARRTLLLFSSCSCNCRARGLGVYIQPLVCETRVSICARGMCACRGAVAPVSQSRGHGHEDGWAVGRMDDK